MASSLSDRAKSALQKLGEFQSDVIGSPGRISTKYVSSEEVPELGIDWAAYAFKCEWENGWVSFSAISADEENMAVYVLADWHSFGDSSPEAIGVPDEERELPCEPYDLLLSNLALRLSQIGLPSIESAKHFDQLRELPLNFYWAEFLGWANFKNSEIEAFFAINRTGKKTAIYLYSGEGVKLDPTQVQNADEVTSDNLYDRGEVLSRFKSLFGY